MVDFCESMRVPLKSPSVELTYRNYGRNIKWTSLYMDMSIYERTCPLYQNQCVKRGMSHYSGIVNGTIHVVVGGGGSRLSDFTTINTSWSLFKDRDWGFVQLTAFNHSSLLFEYKKSSDGLVYDNFTISRDYRDVLACVHDGCEATIFSF